MKKLAFALTAGLLVGCVSTNKTPTPVPAPYRPAPDGGDTVQTEAKAVRLTASNLARTLRVKVAVMEADEKSAADRKLAEVVAPIVRSSLCNAGFEVVFDGDCELAVGGTARFLGGSVRGTRTACRGSVELNFLRCDGRNEVTGKDVRRVVSTKRFDAKSGEARSEEEALMSLGDAFAAPVGKWVCDAGATIKGDLAVCEVSIRSTDGRTPIGRGYPTEFTKTVLAIQGIHDCRIQPMEKSGTVMKAVIVYEPRQVPEGVLNRLMSIKSLKIER